MAIVPLLLLCGLTALVSAAGGEEAAAQTALDSSDPADGSTLERSPDELVLNFTRPLGETNRVFVACNSNPARQISRPQLSDDERTLTVEVIRSLPKGTCTASWRVSEPDGRPAATGSFTFEVEAAPATTSPDTTSASTGDGDSDGGSSTDATDATTGGTEASGDGEVGGEVGGDEGDSAAAEVARIGTFGSVWGLWLGRLLSIGGIAVVFGSLVLIAVAWPEGPEYIIAVRFIRAAWIVGLVGTVLYVAAASASATGGSLGSSINPVEWSDLLDAGWPGRAALARLLLVIAAGWVAFLPERAVESTTQLVGLGIPALAVATIGLTRTTGDLVALGIGMAVLHALAMAVWIGGALFVARIVLAGSGDEDLVHAVRGFSRLSMPAIVVTVVTGIVQLVRLDGGDLFTSGHGRVLLGKSLVVALAVFIAVAARQAVVTRLARAREMEVQDADRLRRTVVFDALLGLGALALTGWMLTYPTPNDTGAATTGDFAVTERVTDPESGVDIAVSLSPGRVGRNELMVEVFEPGEALRGLEVTFIPPEGSDSPRITQAIGLNGEGLAVSSPGGGVPLADAGTWTMVINASTPDGSIAGGRNTFDVRRADGSLVDSVVGSDTDPTSATTTDDTATTTGSTATDTTGDG
ncbi:copper resistance protein CopC [soil metagenome]